MNDKFFSDYCKEIRKELGYSRDKAAELMGDSPDAARLEKIENNKVQSVEPIEVVNMSIAYNKPDLCNYYCTHECDIGSKYGRKSSVKDLAHIAVDTLTSLNKLDAARVRLLEIVEDDKVTEDEMEDFLKIRDVIEKVAATADSLKFWMEKENIKSK